MAVPTNRPRKLFSIQHIKIMIFSQGHPSFKMLKQHLVDSDAPRCAAKFSAFDAERIAAKLDEIFLIRSLLPGVSNLMRFRRVMKSAVKKFAVIGFCFG